jgi:general stress protein YciG
MSAERQKEIARKGGKAAHARGKAHEFTTEEARAAGRKGGERVSLNRSHMAAIGRIGGQRSSRKLAQPSNPADKISADLPHAVADQPG